MTLTMFAIACGERLISPELAIENDKIKEALKARDDDRVLELLNTEF